MIEIRPGKAIKIIREATGLKMVEVACRINMSPTTVSLVESLKREPSIEACKRIEKALRVDSNTLLVLAVPSMEGNVTLTDKQREVIKLVREIAEAQQELKRFLRAD